MMLVVRSRRSPADEELTGASAADAAGDTLKLGMRAPTYRGDTAGRRRHPGWLARAGGWSSSPRATARPSARRGAARARRPAPPGRPVAELGARRRPVATGTLGPGLVVPVSGLAVLTEADLTGRRGGR